MSGYLNNRSYWVDYAKAIGIILVVYGHVARGLVKSGIVDDDGLFTILDSVIYSFHMPLFFFLSGLFFFDSLKFGGKFWLIKNKINTIIKPYVIWSLLQGFVEVALSSYTNGDVSVFQVLSLGWEPRAQFWFLYALFFVFLFSAFVYDFFGDRFIFPLFVLFAIAYLAKSNLPPLRIVNFVVENTVFVFVWCVISEALRIL